MKFSGMTPQNAFSTCLYLVLDIAANGIMSFNSSWEQDSEASLVRYVVIHPIKFRS